MIDDLDFRSIPSTHGRYEVNDQGTVRVVKTKQHVKSSPAGAGYLRISAWIDNKHITKYIHRLVAEVFIGPCPKGLEINHIDGNKLNNNLSNIEYVSHSENLFHSVRIGLRKPSHNSRNRGESHGLSKLTNADIIEIRRLWGTGDYTQVKISKLFGVSSGRIGCIVRGESWKHLLPQNK